MAQPLRSVFITRLKAMREASSMQTWTNSQPTPRLLLWPVRSPVMRCPILLNLPSFLMSMWMSLARPIALVAARRLSRLEGAQPVEAEPLEDAADGGSRDAGFGGDRLAGQALTTKGFDAINDGLRRRSVQAVRP